MYGETLGWFARFMQRFEPTPIQLVKAELKDAELSVLASQSKAEYAALRVQIHKLTAEYHQGRISRLRGFLGDKETVTVE
jgi:hypothetical protein